MATRSRTLPWKIPWTRGACWATVCGASESQTRLNTHTPNGVIRIYICLRLGYFGVVQRLANFFCKAPNSKCFTLCRPHSVHYSCSAVGPGRQLGTICKQVNGAVVQCNYLQK